MHLVYAHSTITKEMSMNNNNNICMCSTNETENVIRANRGLRIRKQ